MGTKKAIIAKHNEAERLGMCVYVKLASERDVVRLDVFTHTPKPIVRRADYRPMKLRDVQSIMLGKHHGATTYMGGTHHPAYDVIDTDSIEYTDWCKRNTLAI